MNGLDTMRLILKELFRVYADISELPVGYSTDIYDGLDRNVDGVSGRTIYEYVKSVQEGAEFDIFKSGKPAQLCFCILKKEGKLGSLTKDSLRSQVVSHFLATYSAHREGTSVLSSSQTDTVESGNLAPEHKNTATGSTVANTPERPLKTIDKPDTQSVATAAGMPDSQDTAKVSKREKNSVEYFSILIKGNTWKMSTVFFMLTTAYFFSTKGNAENVEEIFRSSSIEQAALREKPYIKNFEACLNAVAENEWGTALQLFSKKNENNFMTELDLQYSYRMTAKHTFHYYTVEEVNANKAIFTVDLEFSDYLPHLQLKDEIAKQKIDKVLTAETVQALAQEFFEELKNNYEFGDKNKDSLFENVRTFLGEQRLEDFINSTALMETFGLRNQLKPIIMKPSRTQDMKSLPRMRRNCTVEMIKEDGEWKLYQYSSANFMNGAKY